jgi:hypothetical protein
MPIEYTPSRRLIDAYLRLRRRLRGENPEADQIKSEVIEAVNDDGTYIVKARAIPASGNVKFASGQRVDVVFKNARPRVIVGHNARRVHFSPEVVGGGPIVEMLMLAPVDDTLTVSDIWFRNFNQNTLLKNGGDPPFLTCREQLEAAGFVIGSGSYRLHGWGLDHRRFVVSFTNTVLAHPVLAVFKVGGTEDAPINGTATATLETTYDIGASAIALGAITWHQDPATNVSTSIVLGTLVSPGYTIFIPATLILIQTASGQVNDVILRRDKHLIIGLTVHIVDQDNSLLGFGTVNFEFPVLIDITDGTVLFNGIQNSTVWPGGVYDGAHFINDGVGEFNFTTNLIGGAQLFMVPLRRGNALRVFAAVRATSILTGDTFQWVGAWIIGATPGPTTITQFQTGFAVSGRIWPISRNQRYVIWTRVGPPNSIGGTAFGAPFSSTLLGYDFHDGIHVTDLGSAEPLAIIDKIPVTGTNPSIDFLDTTPFLVSVGLLYQDFDELRILPPDNIKPHFSIFRNQSGVIVPFLATLKTLSGLVPFDNLKEFTAALQFILSDFLDSYDVSGHSDPVVGFSIVGAVLSQSVYVQVIPVNGVSIPPA